MTDTKQDNSYDLDEMPEFTEASIAGEADGLSNGFYFVAVTKAAQAKVSGGGQVMLQLQFSPCKEENNPKSAATTQRLDKYLMLPVLADRGKFAARQNEKNHTTLGEAELDAAWKEAQIRAERDATRTAGALIGYEKLPEVARWNKERRVYLTKSGEVQTKEQKERAAKAQAAAAINLVRTEAKATGLVGYSCYAKIEAEEFNGMVKPAIKDLYEKLPEGAVLRPVSMWFVKD